MIFKFKDINECAVSKCDLSSTDCANTAGSFHCKCRTGFVPNLDCRPVADLGIGAGAIPSDSIYISGNEGNYTAEVCINITQTLNNVIQGSLTVFFLKTSILLLFFFRW